MSEDEAAKSKIEAESGPTGCIEVWELDLPCYASVKALAKSGSSLNRLDAAFLDAGIAIKGLCNVNDRSLSQWEVKTRLQ